jgi:hypothetical protein
MGVKSLMDIQMVIILIVKTRSGYLRVRTSRVMSLIWSQKPITDEDDPCPIHTVGLEVEREPKAAPASRKV